jgi:hypothetical protein
MVCHGPRYGRVTCAAGCGTRVSIALRWRSCCGSRKRYLKGSAITFSWAGPPDGGFPAVPSTFSSGFRDFSVVVRPAPRSCQPARTAGGAAFFRRKIGTSSRATPVACSSNWGMKNPAIGSIRQTINFPVPPRGSGRMFPLDAKAAQIFRFSATQIQTLTSERRWRKPLLPSCDDGRLRIGRAGCMISVLKFWTHSRC